MIRAGNLLLNVRNLMWVELRAHEVRARVADAMLVRRFGTPEEAELYFNDFQAKVAHARGMLD